MQYPTNRSKCNFVKFLACAFAAWLSTSLVQAAPSEAAPSITVAAPSVNAVIAESVTLSVEIDGAHPLRYCWRKNGEVLAEETGAKLKIKNVLPSSAGEYTVEVANRHGTTLSEPISVRVCAPSLRIYRQHGIKLTFKARKCVRYTIECRNSLSEETAWSSFAGIENKNGTVRLTDHSASSHLLCVFRLKAEGACRCGDGHNDDEDDGDGGDHDEDGNNGDDDNDSDEEHDDDHGDNDNDDDDDDDDHHGDDDDD